jgi:4,5-DOPA dioxygenase extradiol
VLPALFVSHGGPTLILDDVPARHFLASLSERVRRPKAILVVSAHWGTREPTVNDVAVNATIHDFYGFPDALYRLQYPAPGAASLAQRVAELAGATVDKSRGLDHGAWVPLMLGWPAADIPVAQLSIQPERDAAWHIALGRRLAPLREEKVLILASGSFTHNLLELRRFAGEAEPAWVSDFAALDERSAAGSARRRPRELSSARAGGGAQPSDGRAPAAALRRVRRRARRAGAAACEPDLRYPADGRLRLPMNPPFQTLALDHVVLRVADLDRALGFYCGALGLPVEKRQEAIGLVQLRAGTSLIDLVPLDGKLGRQGGAGPAAEGRNVDHFALRIAPFDGTALAAHLRAHGVEPGEVVQRYGAEGDGPSMYITDPDGNGVELKGPPG